MAYHALQLAADLHLFAAQSRFAAYSPQAFPSAHRAHHQYRDDESDWPLAWADMEFSGVGAVARDGPLHPQNLFGSHAPHAADLEKYMEGAGVSLSEHLFDL